MKTPYIETCAECGGPLKGHRNGIPYCKSHYAREWKKDQQLYLREQSNQLRAICYQAEALLQREPQNRDIINKLVPIEVRQQFEKPKPKFPSRVPTKKDIKKTIKLNEGKVAELEELQKKLVKTFESSVKKILKSQSD